VITFKFLLKYLTGQRQGSGERAQQALGGDRGGVTKRLSATGQACCELHSTRALQPQESGFIAEVKGQ